MNKFKENIHTRICWFITALTSSAGMFVVALMALTAPKSVFNKVMYLFADAGEAAASEKNFIEKFMNDASLK